MNGFGNFLENTSNQEIFDIWDIFYRRSHLPSMKGVLPIDRIFKPVDSILENSYRDFQDLKYFSVGKLKCENSNESNPSIRILRF